MSQDPSKDPHRQPGPRSCTKELEQAKELNWFAGPWEEPEARPAFPEGTDGMKRVGRAAGRRGAGGIPVAGACGTAAPVFPGFGSGMLFHGVGNWYPPAQPGPGVTGNGGSVIPNLSSLGKQGKAVHALTMPFPSSPFPVPRAQGRREQDGAGTELSSNPAPLPVLESSFPASGIPMDGWEPWDGNHSHPTSQGRPEKSHHSHSTSHRRPGNTQHTHTVLPNRGWGTCHWDLGRKGLFQAPGKLWEA